MVYTKLSSFFVLILLENRELHYRVDLDFDILNPNYSLKSL